MKINQNMQYDRPSITTDAIIFAYNQNNVKLILTKRTEKDEYGKLALIGGFVHPNMTFKQSCIETVKRKINLKLTDDQVFEQRPVSNPARDPRGWVASVPYIVFLNNDQFKQLDLTNLEIFNLHFDAFGGFINEDEANSTEIAFDHEQILIEFIKELKDSTLWSGRVMKLLPKTFTINEAFNLFKLINPESKLVINNFKRSYGKFIKQTNQKSTDKLVGRRAAIFTLK